MKEEEEFERCEKCGKELYVKEIEIYGQCVEIGVFCNSKVCERYLLLVV